MDSIETGTNQKVLIVDDQHALRAVLAKFLRKEGLIPLEAEDGESAIALYTSERPAVVLSDIMMPRMDGLTLLNEIKKIDAKAAVVLMTGYGNEEILLKALRGGAANYFKKPFSFREVIQVLQHLIRHRAAMELGVQSSPYLIRERREFILETGAADIFPVIEQITLAIQSLVPEQVILNLKVGIEEMLKNAIEHGNLGISAEEKNDALEKGCFSSLLGEKLALDGNAKKKILITAEISREEFRITIEDEGAGFDWRSLPNLQAESLLHFSGRGIFLTRIYFDEVIYNNRGNRVTLIKSKAGSREKFQTNMSDSM
jgi:CheY-like chemotaxis protein/anti-sigma regulatory factor (Ser/Thr protein kinase)